jgi:hypothetical protein
MYYTTLIIHVFSHLRTRRCTSTLERSDQLASREGFQLQLRYWIYILATT